MMMVTILLLFAAIAFGIGRLLKLPSIPVLLVMGIAMRSLSVENYFEISEQLLRDFVEIGLAMLVFTAGIDLSPRRMRGKVKPISVVALVQYVFLGLAGWGLALALGYDSLVATYVACALSASSTLVAARQLQYRRQMFEPYGRLVLGVLLFQDIFIIALLVALEGGAGGGNQLLLNLSYMLLLGCLAALAHIRFIPWIVKSVRMDEEELMLFAMALLFGFVFASYSLGLSFVVGAFFAGFALSAFPMNGLVRGMLSSLNAFFLALFFIGLGAFMEWPALNTTWHALVFSLMLVVLTVCLVGYTAERMGYSTRAAIEAGLLLSQTSEFSLLIALSGMSLGHIDSEAFALIVLFTIITMTVTPFLAQEKVTWKLMHLHPRSKATRNNLPPPLKGHVLFIGYGRGAEKLLKRLAKSNTPVVVIDDDAARIHTLSQENINCVQGDGSQPQVLSQAYGREASMVFCSMRRMRDIQNAIRWLKEGSPEIYVRTFEEEETLSVTQAGGHAISTAKLSSDLFMRWVEMRLPG